MPIHRRTRARRAKWVPRESVSAAPSICSSRISSIRRRARARQQAIQEMILADTPEARRSALAKLLPFQRRDFIGIFEAMDGLPVTIRLIDPPLHEFVPHEPAKQEELAKKIGISPEVVARRVEQLHEANPMLGHRGCRSASPIRKFSRCRFERSLKRRSIARSGALKYFLRSCIRWSWTKENCRFLNRPLVGWRMRSFRI